MTYDWATERATDIIANVHRYPFTTALELVATELRLAYAKGERAGAASALEVISSKKRGVAA